MLAVLRHWEPLNEALGDVTGTAGDHAFELSVGYDLAGIQSDRMTAFIAGMLDAEDVIDDLRREIPGPFGHLRDVPVPSRLVDTRHPEHLPRLPARRDRGHRRTPDDRPRPGRDRETESRPCWGRTRSGRSCTTAWATPMSPLVPEAFAADLKFDRALEMIDRLEEFAAAADGNSASS